MQNNRLVHFQVVSGDFVDDVCKGDVVSVIKDKAISDWGAEVRAARVVKNRKAHECA